MINTKNNLRMAKIEGMKRAIELVWEVGTGYSDRTKAIADHIESEIRLLQREELND